MKKIDWARKLTSRKFWAAVVGFVTQIMLASGASDGTVTQTVAVIMAGATLIAYMIAEGFADSSNSGSTEATDSAGTTFPTLDDTDAAGTDE